MELVREENIMGYMKSDKYDLPQQYIWNGWNKIP